MIEGELEREKNFIGIFLNKEGVVTNVKVLKVKILKENF